MITKRLGSSFWINACGWVGTQLLAWCALPQVIAVVQSGSAQGLNPWFLSMWGIGEIFTIIYVYKSRGLDWPLLTNYTINLTLVGILVLYL